METTWRQKSFTSVAYRCPYGIRNFNETGHCFAAACLGTRALVAIADSRQFTAQQGYSTERSELCDQLAENRFAIDRSASARQRTAADRAETSMVLRRSFTASNSAVPLNSTSNRSRSRSRQVPPPSCRPPRRPTSLRSADVFTARHRQSATSSPPQLAQDRRCRTRRPMRAYL
jgi:hypothetical protein